MAEKLRSSLARARRVSSNGSIGVGAGGDRGIDPPTYKSGGIIPPLVRLNSVLNYSATFDLSTHAQCLSAWPLVNDLQPDTGIGRRASEWDGDVVHV